MLRLEDLATGLREIGELTQGRLTLEARRSNRNPDSPSDSYRTVYNARTRDLVARIFERDIDFFGYAF